MSVSKRIPGRRPGACGLSMAGGVLLAGLGLASCSSSISRFDYPMFAADRKTENGPVTTSSINPVPAEPVYQPMPPAETQVRRVELPPPVPAARPAPPPVRTAARTPPARMPLPPAAKPAPPKPRTVTVRVNRGDTLSAIAREHGVSVEQIMAANELKKTNLRVGQTLLIPVKGAPPPARTATKYAVRSGDSLSSIAAQFDVDYQELAKHNNLNTNTILQVGQVLRIPGAAPAAPVKVAARRPSVPMPVAKPAPAKPAAPPAAKEPDRKPATRTALLPAPKPLTGNRFRWPVRGRIISGFGPKPDGKHNDGINVAVPLGASIKAAENGVVAYAGAELEGYGKLILIRHANKWVTAYAHNDEILVKRGDEVRRGQIIAKAGKTGAVSQPQLHFELRRGSQPVDPLKFMSKS